jgi:ribulose-5-phosphate 4-epimerase/fuculose-1-phosphate aldolase
VTIDDTGCGKSTTAGFSDILLALCSQTGSFHIDGREILMGQFRLYQEQVLAYSQALVDSGFLKGTGGNLSLRIPGESALAITPSDRDYLSLAVDDICVFDFEQQPIEGDLRPSREMGLHVAVYRNRPDVRCVIHTHQAYASALSVIDMPIPALFDEQVRFLGRSVEIVPYGPSGTGLLRRNLERKLRSHHNAYILKNHGALCLGPTADRAVHNMLLLEKCAIAYLLALCTEHQVRKIPLVAREVIFAKLRADQKSVERQLAALPTGTE